jgi:hypothetical protein
VRPIPEDGGEPLAARGDPAIRRSVIVPSGALHAS